MFHLPRVDQTTRETQEIVLTRDIDLEETPTHAALKRLEIIMGENPEIHDLILESLTTLEELGCGTIKGEVLVPYISAFTVALDCALLIYLSLRAQGEADDLGVIA